MFPFQLFTVPTRVLQTHFIYRGGFLSTIGEVKAFNSHQRDKVLQKRLAAMTAVLIQLDSNQWESLVPALSGIPVRLRR